MRSLKVTPQLAIGFLLMFSEFTTAWAANIEEDLLADWRETLAQVAMPNGGYGCFQAAYPETTWTQVECGVDAGIPFRNSRPAVPPTHGKIGGSAAIQTVGGGGPTDWLAQGSGLPSGYPTIASGSFPTVSGVTSEYDGAHINNDYSVQLNSNFFSTPACNLVSGCQGWEQFVYSTGLQQFFIQFWLVGYGVGCPDATWTQPSFSTNCFKNSPPATVPALAATGLATLSMAVQSAGTPFGGTAGPTRAWLYIGTNAYYTSDPGTDTLSLTQGWNQAEFNIVGDGNSLDAMFNTGSSISVATSISDIPFNNNLPNANDSCVKDSKTAETNNLNLGNCTATLPHYVTTSRGRVATPSSISFTESN